MLEELLQEIPQGVERADVLLELARTHRADQPATIALLDDALAEAVADDARSAQILAYRALYRMIGAQIPEAIADGHAALRKAEQVGDPRLLAVTVARAAHLEMYAAEITPGLLERGVEIEERLDLPLEYVESPRAFLARLLMRQGDLDRARPILDELEARAAARGDEETRILFLWQLGSLEWLAGRWARALEHVSSAHDLGEQTQFFHRLGWAGRIKALLEADLGLVEQARTTAEAGCEFAATYSLEFFAVFSLGALGRLELALGDVEAAGAYLRDLPERLLAGGLNDPTPPVWADAIETLVGLGELERAHASLEPYELHAERLGSPQARVGAARCRGLLLAAEGDPSAAESAFERLAGRRGRVSPGTRADAALSRRRAPSGAAEAGSAGGAGECARDLRGAGRTVVGGEGTRGASADQRSRACLRRADRDRAAGRRAGGTEVARTRRSPPSCTWA